MMLTNDTPVVVEGLWSLAPYFQRVGLTVEDAFARD